MPDNSSRREWLRRMATTVAATMATTTLAGCGGATDDEDGDARLRVLNLTSDGIALDLELDDETRVEAAAVDTLGDYVAFDPDTYDVDVLRHGGGTVLNTASRTFSADSHYTAVIWGRESALKLATLPEDEDEDDIASGKSMLRIFSASTDLGAVDIYLTRNDTALEDTAAAVSTLAASSLSAYVTLDAGSWRLRVTGAGDSSDLRLDIASLTLTEGRYLTLVLTAGSGGVLVHGTLLAQQQAGLTLVRNAKARLRVLAGVEDRGAVGLSWNGQTVAASLRSPAVGPYTLVDAGEQALAMRVDGNTVVDGSSTLAAGGDYTLLAWGSADAPRLSVLSDDNRLPASTRAKLRLVHAASKAGALTLAVDYAVVVGDLAPGSGSAFVTPLAGTEMRLDVNAVDSASALYAASDVTLQGLGVYTLCLLGGNDSPTGVLRKDR